MTPLELSEVEKRMKPGAWFTHGFLPENASLAEVLAKDAETLARLGSEITAGQIGQKLREVLESAAESDWFWSFRSGEYKVQIRRRRGFITCPWASDEFEPCPFGNSGRPTANEFLIRRKGSNQKLEGFELSAHLIGEHAFFGGPGSRFRIEPEEAVAVLGLRL